MTLSNKLQTLYNRLPGWFSLEQAQQINSENKSTVYYQLKQLIKAGKLCKTSMGQYQKIDIAAPLKVAGKVSTQKTVADLNMEVDQKNGTAKITATACFYPRTEKEIIDVLKIDTTIWELERYWNKEKFDGRWLISALVAKKKVTAPDLLAEVIRNFKPAVLKFRAPMINEGFSEPVMGVLSLQDLHFGKEGNQSIVDRFKACVIDLVGRAYLSYKLDCITFVVGGDLLNMDTFLGTTTSGTPVENSQKATEAYTLAYDALLWAIGYLKNFCNKVLVVYIPGNHDRLSSFHMAHALSKHFNPADVEFDIEYSERKAHRYGINFLGLEHGDTKSPHEPGLWATEFPELWGATQIRTVYTGHKHIKQSKDYITENEVHGLAIKILPSLSATDYWHYHNKYTGCKKAGVMELHSPTKGLVGVINHISTL